MNNFLMMLASVANDIGLFVPWQNGFGNALGGMQVSDPIQLICAIGNATTFIKRNRAMVLPF
ncbi:hypothetical protein ACJX0J_026113 [Zea mays]